MDTHGDIIMRIKPSLRRAYFYSLMYVFIITFARLQLDLEVTHPLVMLAVFVLLTLLAYAHIARACMQYTLTPSQINVRTGIIARKSNRIPLEKITDATTRQSVLERCLGIVNVDIATAGSSEDSEASFFRILTSDAKAFAARYRELKEQKGEAVQSA